MKISVIIPTYKPSDYIWQCLNSLKKQTFDHNLFEIKIVLNGCKEPYASQISDYIINSLSKMNIDFIQTDTLGVSNARNIALDTSKSEYICFLDDDDYISPSYLSELYSNSNSDTIALSNTIAFYDQTEVIDKSYCINKAFLENATSNIIQSKKYFNGPCMKLIHRNIIGTRRFNTKYRNGEDSLFMFLISDKIKQCTFTSNQAIYYRRHRNNSAVSTPQKLYKTIFNSCFLIIEYTKIILLHPLRYNHIFYITRILAELHSWLIRIRHK